MKGNTTFCRFSGPFMKTFLCADEKGDDDPEPEGYFWYRTFFL